MGFADDVNYVRDNMSPLLEAAKVLTPEVISAIDGLADVDIDEIIKAKKAAKAIKENKTLLEAVQNGIPDIKAVIGIQNQVKYISDIRDVIGVVAGSIPEILKANELAFSIVQCNGMEPTLNRILDMKDSIEGCLLMEGEIELTSAIAESLKESIFAVEAADKKAKERLDDMESALNKIKSYESKLDGKINHIEKLLSRMKEFSVEVDHVGSDAKASSIYSPTRNELVLSIPKGREGKKGNPGKPGVGSRGKIGIPGVATNQGKPGRPGKDGRDFGASLFGNKRDINRYGNRPIGTSFISLDESPVMIYFRKSNAKNDWTEGQPFGLSNGENANINVFDSERLGGLTLEELYSEIQKAFNEFQKGK